MPPSATATVPRPPTSFPRRSPKTRRSTATAARPRPSPTPAPGNSLRGVELRATNALLTGAAGGLGGYIARALAAEGVNLVLSDLPDADLDPLAEELRARGVRVELVTADLSDGEQRGDLFARAEEALGQIDILVNNA